MTPGIISFQLTIKIDHFMPGIPENGCGDILMQTKVLPSFRLVNPEMFATFVMVSFQKSPTNISNDMTKNLILAAAMLLAGGAVAAQPKVIAHRGYWTAPESAQNSIASFTKADAVGVFGSEIDVWLTADDKLIVNHDRIYKGTDVNMEKATAKEITAIVLPNGTGKTVRVCAIAKGAAAAAAEAAGADIVGDDELIARIAGGFMDFDVVVTTPDMMGRVGRLGKVLGPRGLMPNPKAGTVAPDLGKAVTEAKAGKIEYRLDKQNIIHVPVGKASFGAEKLYTNLDTVMSAIAKAKPAAAKGTYFKSATIATTMGPGIRLNTLKYGV